MDALNRKVTIQGCRAALVVVSLAAAAGGNEILWALPQEDAGRPNLQELAARKGIRPILGPDQDIFLYDFGRGGIRRESLVLTPGAVFEADFAVEQQRPCASLLAAMPFNLGDGATLDVAALSASEEVQLVHLHIDPAHNRKDRSWIPLRFKIPQFGKPFRVRFKVQPGPNGDFTGDWIGIAPGPDSACLFSQFTPAGPVHLKK